MPQDGAFDLVVIGGGSSGYAAASKAVDGGAKVAVVDAGPLAGLCILRGCMPSKALLQSSTIAALTAHAGQMGVETTVPRPDLGLIQARKRWLIEDFTGHRVGQLVGDRFHLIRGKARFLDPHRIQVGRRVLRGAQFVIATGSSISSIPIPGLSEVGALTSDDLLEFRRAPESMVVLGGGSVAAELGQFYSRIGTQTTLIQRSSHLFSRGDEDVARPVEARLREEGMRVYTGTVLKEFSRANGRTTVRFDQNSRPREVAAEVVFDAMGRKPNLAGLGLAEAGVAVESGKIVVSARMQTSATHIYAVGDCIGEGEIVHIAIEEGEIAAHNALNPDDPQDIDRRLQASVTFTDPQVASVGLSEKACEAQDIAYLTASYPFGDHGKSLIMGAHNGFVKLLCDPESGELLGGHIVGPEAGDLIHELIAVMYYRGTVADLTRIPHYHPTLAEIITYPAEELAEQIS